MLIFRNLLYWLGLCISMPPYSIIGLLLLPAPRRFRQRVIASWALVLMWALEHLVGLKYKVIGRENIPDTPSIISSKHQSGWETLALQSIFPHQVFVAKRELLWIPFFGWGLAAACAIMIDRRNRMQANRQLIEQGEQRIRDGFWITIFPEGTRPAPGKRGKYKLGGARLARDIGVPLVPVALNSGEFWPRNSFFKYPGEITVVIGKPVMAADAGGPEAMMRQVEEWIEARQAEISGVGPCASPEDRARRLARLAG